MQNLGTRADASSVPAATILALVVLANDECSITATIESLGWADACIAVDLGCTDATAEVCRRLGVPVVVTGDVDREIARSGTDWVLLVEGHERVPAELAVEIRRVVGSSRDRGPAAYVIGREVEFLGRKLRSRAWNAPEHVRLVRRRAGIWNEGAMMLESRAVDGAHPGSLEHRLHARPYESLKHFVTRVDVLTTVSARVMRRSGAAVRWIDLALYPAARAARCLPGASVRDGIVGAIFVVLDAYRLVLVSAKRWEQERLPELTERER